VLLVGAAPKSEGVLMMKVETDPEGGDALQRSLDRDPVAIPGAISSGGHVPRPTDCEEKLVNADDADAAHRDRFANGIQELRSYVKEAEEQLRRDEVDIRMTGNVEQGLTESHKSQETFRANVGAHAQICVAPEDTKTGLREWERQ
jgi:hypothetical protein